jgi:hypothetical protein
MPFRINLLGGNFDYSSGIHQTVIELRQNCLAVPGGVSPHCLGISVGGSDVCCVHLSQHKITEELRYERKASTCFGYLVGSCNIFRCLQQQQK